MDASGQLHAPAALPVGKDPLVCIGRRMTGPQSQSEHGGEDKNSLPLRWLEPPIIQLVA